MSKLTVEQIERVVIDAGVVYINYGESDERVLAPCKGDNTFEVEREVREIEANSLKGKTKGMRRIISENASLEVNLMDLSIENLQMALPGSEIVAGELINGWKIKDSDYIKSVTILGEDMGGKFKKITVFNALVDENLSVAFVEDDESAIAIKFAAHYDPADKTDSLYKISEIDKTLPEG